MKLIHGKALALQMQGDLKAQVGRMTVTPCLAILLVGDDPASHLYVSLKKKVAEEVGIRVIIDKRPANLDDETLLSIIKKWNDDPTIHGILVQLPLPSGHDEEKIIETIEPIKDADGFHPSAAIIPPVHQGILRLISLTPLSLAGSQAAIIANSNIFAVPLERLLTRAGMSVRVMRPDEVDGQWLFDSDLVVIAVGRSNFLNAHMTKSGVVIIDVGTNKTTDNKIHGDVDIESYKDQHAWVTPVPGGVGPMTIVELLKNVTVMAQDSSSSHPHDSNPSGRLA